LLYLLSIGLVRLVERARRTSMGPWAALGLLGFALVRRTVRGRTARTVPA
jgi:hypothetical protein